ncbi:MAG: TetR/AcrR family transcriptional regulator C-terminal domain-containing protein [Clostridia bacterium]|nr:TetR/AcrR family transcriptional regulator C-terminal domain-containing protein [Clostridia bacterium]
MSNPAEAGAAQKKQQRNSLRSEKLIKKAFAKLLHERDFSKITVSDIVKEAEICRGTFYAHYLDINDLFEQMETEIVSDITNYINATGVVAFLDDPRPTVEFCLALIEKDKEYYKNLLLNKSAMMISEKIIRDMREKVLNELTSSLKLKTKEETQTFLVFVSGGIECLFIRWLKNDVPMSTDKVVTMMCNMISACKFAFVNETLFL